MQERSGGGGRRLIGQVRTADDTARVTTFELFFDLVYVFAFTQVSRLMAETHSAFGILQALIVLGLLWWTWCAYSWLANQAPADQGVLRLGMSVAMISVFVIALAIPEAYEDLPGGWFGPIVLVVAYTIVRLVHMARSTSWRLVAIVRSRCRCCARRPWRWPRPRSCCSSVR